MMNFCSALDLHKVKVIQIKELAIKSQRFAMGINNRGESLHDPVIQKGFHGHLRTDTIDISNTDRYYGLVLFHPHFYQLIVLIKCTAASSHRPFWLQLCN